MNCLIASSVCGEVGLFAIEVEEPREEEVEATVEERDREAVEAERELPVMEDEGPPDALVDEEAGCGGWWRRRKRAPLPVRKAET